MDNNINFKGGYLLKKPTRNMWEKIYNETVPKHRIIINDLYEKENIFFASKSCYDSSILTYLLSQRNLKFTYYPNINLKNRLNAYNPQEAIETLDSELAIDSRKEIKKYTIPPKNIKPKNLKYRWKHQDHIEQTLKALKLNPQEYTVETKNFVTAIYDKNNKLVAKVSPNNQSGINYAIIYPRFSDEKLTMAAINHNGEIISKSSNLDSLPSFKKQFLIAVKIDAGRKRKVNIQQSHKIN